MDDPIEKAKFDDLLNPVVVERPEAELDRQDWMTSEQSRYFRAELEKTIVMDKKNNTFSFYLPVLPEGFEWDIGFNVHYGPNVEDRSYILYEGNRRQMAKPILLFTLDTANSIKDIVLAPEERAQSRLYIVELSNW